MKVLFISNFVPYPSIRHAGGQTFNYYFSKALENNRFDVRLIGLCHYDEIQTIKQTYTSNVHPIITNGKRSTLLSRLFFDFFHLVFKKHSYEYTPYKKKQILKECKNIKKAGFNPDIIVLEWTASVMLAKSIKNLFPKAALVASEHDVSFLHAERDFENSKGLKRMILKNAYHDTKAKELDCLRMMDKTMVHNQKDAKLLIKNNIESNSIFELTPFYHNMSFVNRCVQDSDVLFWGAMNRKDNYEAALWFAKNVMPLLSDTEIRFVVVGNKPPKELVSLSNDKVKVVGFVESEVPFFANSFCFVSPLQSGAGIKIKNLEAFSSGIPVVSNKIGVEGIPVSDNVEYFHAETPKEFARAIKLLYQNREMAERVGRSGKIKVTEYFNLLTGEAKYMSMLEGLVHE